MRQEVPPMLSKGRNSSSNTGSIFRHLRASAFSLGTINTVLPDYNVIDPNLNNSLQDPPVYNTSSSQLSPDIDSTTNEQSTPSRSSTSKPRSPSQYSPTNLTLVEWRPNSPATPFSALPGNIVAQSEPYEFHYWYPIKSNSAWATLHLYTRDAVPGNPKPSKVQPKVPQVWSCDPVAGMVELDCTSLQTIHQIKVSVCSHIWLCAKLTLI